MRSKVCSFSRSSAKDVSICGGVAASSASTSRACDGRNLKTAVVRLLRELGQRVVAAHPGFGEQAARAVLQLDRAVAALDRLQHLRQIDRIAVPVDLAADLEPVHAAFDFDLRHLRRANAGTVCFDFPAVEQQRFGDERQLATVRARGRRPCRRRSAVVRARAGAPGPRARTRGRDAQRAARPSRRSPNVGSAAVDVEVAVAEGEARAAAAGSSTPARLRAAARGAARAPRPCCPAAAPRERSALGRCGMSSSRLSASSSSSSGKTISPLSLKALRSTAACPSIRATDGRAFRRRRSERRARRCFRWARSSEPTRLIGTDSSPRQSRPRMRVRSAAACSSWRVKVHASPSSQVTSCGIGERAAVPVRQDALLRARRSQHVVTDFPCELQRLQALALRAALAAAVAALLAGSLREAAPRRRPAGSARRRRCAGAPGSRQAGEIGALELAELALGGLAPAEQVDDRSPGGAACRGIEEQQRNQWRRLTAGGAGACPAPHVVADTDERRLPGAARAALLTRLAPALTSGPARGRLSLLGSTGGPSSFQRAARSLVRPMRSRPSGSLVGKVVAEHQQGGPDVLAGSAAGKAFALTVDVQLASRSDRGPVEADAVVRDGRCRGRERERACSSTSISTRPSAR